MVRGSDCSIDREVNSGFGLNVAVVRPAQSDGVRSVPRVVRARRGRAPGGLVVVLSDT